MSYNKRYYRSKRNMLLNKQKKRNAARKADIRSYMESYYKDNRKDLLKAVHYIVLLAHFTKGEVDGD